MTKRFVPQSAFTLIELLVVIAIIAVLAALAFPVIGRVKDNGYTSETISNLRNLQLANISYASDHNGRYVSPQETTNGNSVWFVNKKFLGYLGVTDANWDEKYPEVAKCGFPSASPPDPKKNDRQQSIGINLGGNLWYPDKNGNQPDSTIGMLEVDPSKMFAFCDATAHFVRMSAAGDWTTDEKWNGMKMAYRNRGRAAVVYFDGHTGLVSKEESVGNDVLWLPPKP